MAAIDTHCHLNLVHSMHGLTPETALEQAWRAGVRSVVQVATGLEVSRYNRQFVPEFNRQSEGLRLYWTAGLHPEGADDLSDLDAILEIVREGCSTEWFLGVGETGLDYFHSTEHVKNQKESFSRHLDLARELSLPVVTHLRDDRVYTPGNTRSVTDALLMVRARKGVRGVLHCFTYSYEEAMPFVDLGWFVSYSGILTFKNARHLQEGAARLPLSCLLVETDAPFLAPVPMRGKPNEPAYVAHTLDFLADLRSRENGEDPDVVRETVLRNSEKFINWKNET